MSLPMPKAELIGTFLEALGYGAYLIVFAECLQVLYMKHKAGRDMRFLLATALVIFALITVHLVVDLTRAIDAFTNDMDVAGAPLRYFGTINTTLNIAKSATYVTVTLVLDALIVYRTFVIWGRNFGIIAFPFLLFLADIGLSAWATWSLTEVKDGDDVLVANVTLRVKYFYTITLALNLFCTLMIAYKIWSVHRSVTGQAAGGVRITGIISVVLESAAIYSVLLIFLIVTSAIGNPAMFLVLTSISPIIGMVFSAVIVRASREYHSDTFMTTNMSFAVRSNFSHRQSDGITQFYTARSINSTEHHFDSMKEVQDSAIELDTMRKMEAGEVKECEAM